jgi:hypothetical protein
MFGSASRAAGTLTEKSLLSFRLSESKEPAPFAHSTGVVRQICQKYN